MRILFFILTFQASCLFAQLDLSIHAGGGASLIYNSATVNMNHSFYGSPIRSIPKRSYEVGVTGRKYFERTYLETGISYSYIQSLHKENTFAQDPATSFIEEIHIEKLRHIGYAAIPVVFCRNYGSFSIGAGIQPQFTLHVREDKKMWILHSINGGDIDPILKNRTIKTFDLGIVGQANLEATERISLNFKLYWGITNINNFQEKGVAYEFYQIESPVIDRRLKNKQFVLTLQYKLFQKKAV
ncbi:MAG: outer membrane beta-barrel protein [Crocinitomicaceae bacterium]|jgi:hypothetical protein|nr:outer membrane beta-barrel protein [Crocinitomicaceae bacterium]